MATSFHKVNNNAASVLASAIDDNDLALSVSSGDGAEFDSVLQYLTIGRDETYAGEVVEASSRSTDAFTLAARAQDGTTATAHDAGVRVECLLVAAHITEIQDAINGIENGTTTLAGLVVAGKITNTYTESSIADSRPVTIALTHKFTPSSAPGSGLDFHGIDLVGWTDDADANANTRLYPFESTAMYSAGGTLGALVPAYLLSKNTSTGTVNLIKNLRMWHKNESTGTVADLNYIYIENPQNGGGGTITAAKGIYIEDITTGTTNWGLYSLAPNYMAELGIANGPAVLASTFEVGGTGSSNYQAYLKGKGATSSTWALVIQNGSGSSIADFRDDRLTTIRNLSIATTLSVTGVLTASGGITMADAQNVVLNTTTGSKLGTATSQKLGFWNAAPIIQPASANQAALTNSTAGTYDGTLAALADLTDSPASADALRDDIVTNLLPVLRNNFTDLFTLLDAIRTAMVNSGLMKGAA